jgi:hypothetical protein
VSVRLTNLSSSSTLCSSSSIPTFPKPGASHEGLKAFGVKQG